MAFSHPALRRVGVALLLAVAAIGPTTQANAAEKLRIATEGTYFPWSYRDAKGQLVGYDVEIAALLCARMKVECDVVAQDWDGIIPGLLAKKFDAIVASMAITPARQEKVAFTERYKDSISRFIAPKGKITDTSLTGLKGKVIAVQRGSSQHKWLEAEGYGKVATINLYDTTEGPELDLLAGRADVMLGNMFGAYVGFFKRAEAAQFEFVGPELKGGILGAGSGIALRKEDTALLAAFNKALAEIDADGSYKALGQKYFPFPLK